MDITSCKLLIYIGLKLLFLASIGIGEGIISCSIILFIHPCSKTIHKQINFLQNKPMYQIKIINPFFLLLSLTLFLMACQDTPLADGKDWNVDFDDHNVGDYSYLQQNSDWSTPKWQMGRNLISVVDGEEAYSGKSLRLKCLKGVSSCKEKKECISWPVDLGVKVEKLYYGFRFKLSKDFSYIKGGKFPGIAGGRANTGGHVPTGIDGWSVRMMWDGKGRLVQYVYHPDQPGDYGDVLFWQPARAIELGKWHTIQTMVQLNQPSKTDGRIISWLNGKIVLDEKDFHFRDINGLEIDRFQFVSFFGGQGADWAPTKDEYTYIDDIRLSVNPVFYDMKGNNIDKNSTHHHVNKIEGDESQSSD